VEKSGAPRGEKFSVRESARRQPFSSASAVVLARRGALLRVPEAELQLIVFAQSRLTTEILTTYLKDDFEDVPGAPERIRAIAADICRCAA